MTAHTPIAARLLGTAREIAREHRKNPASRQRIERLIHIEGRSEEFRYNRHGDLIAKFTDADRAHRDEVRGCDGYFRSEKALGIEQRCVAGMPGVTL